MFMFFLWVIPFSINANREGIVLCIGKERENASLMAVIWFVSFSCFCAPNFFYLNYR